MIWFFSFEVVSVFVAKSLVDGDQIAGITCNLVEVRRPHHLSEKFSDIIAERNWFKGDETALAVRCDK